MIRHWDALFEAPVEGRFFGGLNVSITVPEGQINRESCMEKMGRVPLVTPYQYHSHICHVVGAVPQIGARLEGDALVTAVPGLAIGVVTADCAPILFSGQTTGGQPLIGAAHAGARGALRGIIKSTVEALRDLGAERIRAVIGPCIYPDSYEVGPEFYDEFTRTDIASLAFFRPNADKYRFDLPGYCGWLLDHEGVAHTATGIDTYTSPECFSYRRARHAGEPDYGRQLSAIRILS